MVLINGELREAIAAADRGFQYGDGLFETIEVNNGQPVFMDRHLDRLQRGCRRLLIPCPDRDLLASEAQSLVAGSALAVLKIIVTRGSGGRGYRQPDTIRPTRVVSLHPFPNYPEAFNQQGIRAIFCSTRLGLNPTLAGIKHLNRLEQVMARAEWNDVSIQEGLMLDQNDRVIEGTMTNLFYVRNNRLYTAPVTEAGIAGIMREVVIELAERNELEVVEHFFTAYDLLAAEEIFVSNSIIGLWPVRQLADHSFMRGPVTDKISQWLARYKRSGLRQC